jgi:hypothetical protein
VCAPFISDWRSLRLRKRKRHLRAKGIREEYSEWSNGQWLIKLSFG